ncbi:MAG TPA: hypothetical protein VD965_13880 [Burkholderiales bacterium]|nr:hypothetical protein [Burkholderiales bacterium]
MLERLRNRRTTERGAKQRLRAIKRDTGKPVKPSKAGPAPQGQRKAIRGNRTRQRHT